MDGVDDYMAIPSTNTLGINTIDGFATFFVAKANDTSPNFLMSSSVGSKYEMHQGSGSLVLRNIYDDTPYADYSIGPESATDAHIFQMLVTDSLTPSIVDIAALVNGNQKLSAVSNTLNSSDYNMFIGSRTGTVLFFDGIYGEVIIIAGAISVSDRQKVEGYLAHKWGLEANLPVSHPYKSASPTV
jgi:hypothetical protein